MMWYSIKLFLFCSHWGAFVLGVLGLFFVGLILGGAVLFNSPTVWVVLGLVAVYALGRAIQKAVD